MYICDKTIPKTKSKPRKTLPPFRGKPFEQISCLKSGNTIITDDKAKADALVTHYDNMLSSDNLSEDFIPIKEHIESRCNTR